MLVVAVVEDDASVLDAIKLVLESHGWEAAGYATGEAFLADRAEGRHFDCVLLDPHLSGKSGVEVAEVMAGCATPVLVLTARPDSPLTVAIARLGARAVITKPVDAAALVEAIEAVVPGCLAHGCH